MSVRAKFKVESITQTTNGHSVALTPVTGGSPENEQFFKWTPYGKIEMGVISAETAAKFQPGQQVYVDFTPVES